MTSAGSGDDTGASAAVAYRAGDVIVACDPFVHLLASQLNGRACHNCYKMSSSLKKCSQCRSFSYCSQSCQKQDWKSFHKHGECSLYAKANENAASLPDPAQLALRLYLMIKAEPELRSKQFKLHDSGSRSLDDLVTHEMEMGKLRSAVAMCAQRIVKIDGEVMKDEADIGLFHVMFHKLRINDFSIRDAMDEKFGAGLFIEASVFNHSCRPNAARVFDGKHMQVRAMRRIAVGEEITLQYGSILYPKDHRQKHLKEGFHFVCNCMRCQEDDAEEEAADLAAIAEYDDFLDEVDPFDKRSSVQSVKKLLQILPIKQKYLGEYHPFITKYMILTVDGITRFGIRSEDDARHVMQLVNKLSEAACVTNYGPVPMFERMAPLIAAVQTGEVARVIQVANQLVGQYVPSAPFNPFQFFM